MKSVPKLGTQELEVLRFVSENSPQTVREVALHFEQRLGLARTTVLTVMERLRRKGFLSREKVDGVFQYAVRFEQEKILQQKVSEFIEKTLGGSLSPLVNYFSSAPGLTAEELEQLRKLTEKIEKMEGQ